MEHSLSDNGLALIKSFEGLRLRAYQDVAGIWTIGYGHTGDVEEGDEVTQHQADMLLRHDARAAVAAVNAASNRLNQNQFDALVSFAFNLGGGMLEPEHSIGKALRAGDMNAVRDLFSLYNHAGGKVVEGLTRRRERERQLFVTPTND